MLDGVDTDRILTIEGRSAAAEYADLALVIREIGKNVSPTPAEIGDAITQVTGLSPGNPESPLLASVLPWWNDFLAAAQVYGSAERQTFVAFRQDLLAYMIAFYATLEA